MSFHSGAGGQTSNTQYGSNSISGPVAGSPYEVFQNEQLANISDLSNNPYRAYDVNKMFAPFNTDQQAAFQGYRDLYNSLPSYFTSGYNALQGASGAAYDPVKAASGAFSQAAGTPTGLDTANPYLQQSGQSASSIIDQYFNPYVDKAVNAANRLSSQNFLQNTLPGITDQFVASGGGLGGKNYGRDMNWALTNFNTALGNTTQQALAAGYNSSLTAAQNDLARQGQLASTAGNLALGDLSGRTNLGIAQGNNAALGTQNAVNLASGYGNLGSTFANSTIAANNALLNSGNQQQQQAQLPLTAAYEQFREGQQWPYQTAGWAANTANQYTWPMRQNTQGWQSTQSQSSQSGSPLGSILGGLATIGSLAIPGDSGVSAIGNLMGGVGSMFGGGSGGGTAPKSGGYLRGRVDGGIDLYARPNSRGRRLQTYNNGGFVTRQGGYLNMNAPMEARTIAPVNTFGEPLSRGFFNYRPSLPPKAQPAFSNTYARGGHVDEPEDRRLIASAVHKHERVMHGAKKGELTKLRRGGYLSLNTPSKAPKTQPAFKDTYATGGAVAVIKTAKANTKRSNKASERRKQIAAQMSRRGTPVDLEPRSGFFQ